MTKAVVLDAEALNLLQQGPELPADWMDNFELPANHDELKLIKKGDINYILPKSVEPNSRALIIKLQDGKLFSGVDSDHRIEAFDRCVKAALSIFEPTVSVPFHWKPFSRGSVLSFQSNSRASGETSRILIDRQPLGSEHAYAFDLTTRQQDFVQSQPDNEFFLEAAAGFEKALTEISQSRPVRPDHQRIVDLTGRLPQGFTYGLSLDDWYKSKLTKSQREFIDFPMVQSVRLRGPAGTVKTIALIIKFFGRSIAVTTKVRNSGLPFSLTVGRRLNLLGR